jgi:hypothetical protein
VNPPDEDDEDYDGSEYPTFRDLVPHRYKTLHRF